MEVRSSCDIWEIALDVGDEAVANCLDILSEAEAVRADRLARHADRRTFVLCRAALRWLLADTLGCAPQAVAIATGTGGKPRITGSPISFSVSHDADTALVAMTNGIRIGIDLERIDRFEDVDIADLVLCADERARYDAMPSADRAAILCRAWVMKEAFLKALGVGLSASMAKLRPAPNGFIAEKSFEVPLPRVQSVIPWSGAGRICALAALDGSCAVEPQGALVARSGPGPLFARAPMAALDGLFSAPQQPGFGSPG